MPDLDNVESQLGKLLEAPEEFDWAAPLYLLGMLAVVAAFLLLAFVHFKYVAMYPSCIAACSFGLAIWGTIRKERKAEQRRQERLQVLLRARGEASDYFEKLVSINVENLSAYYIMVKAHANKSFLASLFAGLIGFGLITTGIYLSATNTLHAQSVATLSGLSGITTEFISAVFFYLYNKTVRQLKEYHDSLISVQNILLSFKLVGDTNDPQDKAKMISVMLDYLVGQKRPQG